MNAWFGSETGTASGQKGAAARKELTILLRKLCLATAMLLAVEATNGATVTWVGGSGDWNTTNNRSTGALPGTNDDVVISPAATITVTHSAGTPTVKWFAP